MPIGFITDHAARRVVATVADRLTAQDLEQYVSARLAAGVYDYDQVIDVGGAEIAVAPDAVLATVLPNRLALRGGVVPFTALVASTPVNRSAARDLAVRFGALGATVEVYETVDGAHQWLDARRRPTGI